MGRVIAVPTAENPTGSGFLPRKLKRCPRKATARSANQHTAIYDFRVKKNNPLENSHAKRATRG
ncbi:hypothetical protein GH741_15095 [Aquibacillus halophilus]|uniref:Uncharacterized protein n=1 Tax=Aquibacillus halophilus TaxID=930132 RepID=A0A6A8DE40_9BACI|nr:hypothetical protein [Aquibacillus halophilus]MRH43968.1 hypothetical protein [Aquibacillus halophilus]